MSTLTLDKPIHHIPLCSRQFRGVGYRMESETMEVVRRDDTVATYAPIPIAVWNSIQSCPNKSIVERLEEETKLRRPVSVEPLA